MLDMSMAMIERATAAAEWVVVLPVVLLLMGAALLLMLRRAPLASAVLGGMVILAVLACEIALVLRIVQSGPVSMTMGKWLPPFGISFSADLFGAGFALAAAVATLAIWLFALAQRRGEDQEDGFFALVLLLLGGVTGAFLTGDLFNLYVWFEVTLIASFGLMAVGATPRQVDGAVKYGFLNVLATAVFLLALGLLYGLLGTLNMADIIGKAPTAPLAGMAGVAALLLLAFGMKAASFPLNAWLPATYHTPQPAVSALFAGLLTKVGAYAVLRSLLVLLPAMRELFEPLLLALVVATLVLAPLGAIAETNLRRAIGFLVIGGIGAALCALVLPGVGGVGGAWFYIVHSMLTMTALYLVAGLVEKLTGEIDSRRMGGVYAANSSVSIAFFILILASAGVPPLLGFWPKLLLLQAGLGDAGGVGITVVVALLLNAVLTLIAGTRLWAHIFWRPSEAPIQPPVRIGRGEMGVVMALVLLIVAAGLWPNMLFAAARIAAGDIVDPARYIAAVGLAGGAP